MIPFAPLHPEPIRGRRKAKARFEAGGRKRDRCACEGKFRQDVREANVERYARGWDEIQPFLPPGPELHCVPERGPYVKKSRARHEAELETCAEPLVIETDQHRWHRAYHLLDKLRPISRQRTAQCRRFRTSKTVQVFSDGKTIKFSGLCTCGNCWGCPVCSLAIQIRRGGEIEFALERWMGARERLGPPSAAAYMLTGTLRHAVSHKLADTSQVIADAWSLFFAGREGQELREALAIEHSIRALEATYGDNGWHPHVHSVVMVRRPWTASEVTRVQERWQWAVERSAGFAKAFRPNEGHGMNVKRLAKNSDGKYLQKMFLELTSSTSKQAKGQNLSYWEVAQRAADGDSRYARVWQEAQHALFGRKQLTWSHGSKRFFAIEELTDESLAHEDGIDATPLAETFQIEIPGAVWDSGWRRDRLFGSRVVGAVRHAAESGDYSSLLALLSERLARQGGGVECVPASRELCALPACQVAKLDSMMCSEADAVRAVSSCVS